MLAFLKFIWYNSNTMVLGTVANMDTTLHNIRISNSSNFIISISINQGGF